MGYKNNSYTQKHKIYNGITRIQLIQDVFIIANVRHTADDILAAQ
jgi:hypothetical protein